MLGKPVVKGIRLTFEHVLRELATGMGHDEALASYPIIEQISEEPPRDRWS